MSTKIAKRNPTSKNPSTGMIVGIVAGSIAAIGATVLIVRHFTKPKFMKPEGVTDAEWQQLLTTASWRHPFGGGL